MNVKVEGKLLQYLQGQISFSEWLDGANSAGDDVRQDTSATPSFSILPSTSVSQEPNTSYEYMHGSSDAERNLVSNAGRAASIVENRFQKGLLGIDDDDDDAADVDDNDDLDYDYGEDDNEDEVLDDADSLETDQATSFEAGPSHGKVIEIPEFSLPDVALSSNTDDRELHRSIFEIVKNMSKILTNVAKSVNLGTEDPSVKKVFAEFIAPKQRRLRKSGPSSHKLREDLRQQMGMANLYLAKGQIDEAIEVCMEIIRQAPHNPHAFKTLSVIYDEKGDTEKSLQFALISAFLGYQDPHEWRDLAIRCLHSGNRKQAIVCYNNGCKVSKGNIVLRWERASLVFEDGDFKRALDLYHKIFKLIPTKDGESMVELGKQIAQLHHGVESVEKAIDVLEMVSEKYPHQLDLEGVNMLAELHISSKSFQRALEIICKHSSMRVPRTIISSPEKQNNCPKDDEEGGTAVKLTGEMLQSIKHMAESSETVPEVPNVEFTTRFAESLIQNATPLKDTPKQTDLTTLPSSWTDFLLSPAKESQSKDGGGSEHHEHQVDASQKDIVDLDQSTAALRQTAAVVDRGNENQWFIPDDLPIDIRVKTVICLIELKANCNIKHILEPMFSEDIELVGDLYLDVSEAYINVGRCEDALTYLEALIKSEKFSKAAVWLKIAECRQTIGLLSEAVVAYYKVLDLAPDQLSVTLELANLCRRLGRTEEAIQLLSDPNNLELADEKSSQGVIEISNKDDFKLWYQKCTLLHGQGHNTGLAENGYIFFMNYFKSAAISREEGLSKALVWELFVKVLQAMVSTDNKTKAKEVVEKATSFRSFSENRRYRYELEFISATTYFLIGDYARAFDAFRWALVRAEKKGLNSPAMWNFFCRIVNNMPDRKNHKYILRMLFKHPAVLPLIIANGHNAFLSGSYKYAIGEYIRAFRMKPQDPVLSMCIGISYLHIACQRFTKHRHTSVLQGIAFMLQYYQMRGKTQEACYNLARAFHQVGLIHFAFIFYNKALNFPTRNEKYSQFDDLHREAAYNLSIIYRNSGNIELARRTLYKYVWI